MLKQLAAIDIRDHPYSLIDTSDLSRFYEQSLKTDNFHGLGHLITYVQKYGLNIGKWDLGQFKSALEFYLNQNFSLTNVLIFTKYYTEYHSSRLRALNIEDVSKLSEGEKFSVNEKVFDQSNLVDMRALFGYLVLQLGTR